MDYKNLIVDIEGDIGLITLNRPEALNALNTSTFDELNEVLDQVEQKEQLRVLIVTGAGKAFIAGADIAEMQNKTQAEARSFAEYGQRTLDRIQSLKIPVIAAINGFALGGGLELAMACDIRIASSKAKMGQPEVNLGLIPGFGGSQRLPRIAGLGNSLYMLLTGEMIDAQEALRIGLVWKVVEPENLMPEVNRIAEIITTRGPLAVSLLKQTVHEGMQTTLAQGLKLEAQRFGKLFGEKSQGKEGMTAFLEKRKPNWQSFK
ncbi:MAG: crotonase [Bacteroidales bacterium]|jgi:enoyl-CoA hydratase|nr:crotonase [Bacteroidales bacterium]NPV35206.1 crotonase [Bacteroidales bacterium]